jgi:hypothetical protein
MAERIKLGGLWLNKTRDGREYLSGRLSPTVKILIFKNDFKTTDNQPTHVMYLAPIEQQPDEAARGGGGDSFFGEAAERDEESPEERPAPERPAAEKPVAERPAPEPRPAPRAGSRPAPTRGATGRAAPLPDQDDLSDLDDPFAE